MVAVTSHSPPLGLRPLLFPPRTRSQGPCGKVNWWCKRGCELRVPSMVKVDNSEQRVDCLGVWHGLRRTDPGSANGRHCKSCYVLQINSSRPSISAPQAWHDFRQPCGSLDPGERHDETMETIEQDSQIGFSLSKT
jgi:hypothetical protein